MDRFGDLTIRPLLYEGTWDRYKMYVYVSVWIKNIRGLADFSLVVMDVACGDIDVRRNGISPVNRFEYRLHLTRDMVLIPVPRIKKPAEYWLTIEPYRESFRCGLRQHPLMPIRWEVCHEEVE